MNILLTLCSILAIAFSIVGLICLCRLSKKYKLAVLALRCARAWAEKDQVLYILLSNALRKLGK